MNPERHFECCKCGWIGPDKEKDARPSEMLRKLGVIGTTDVCPECGHDLFYDVPAPADPGSPAPASGAQCDGADEDVCDLCGSELDTGYECQNPGCRNADPERPDYAPGKEVDGDER